MAICTQFYLHICSLDPKFQINRIKNNFAKGQKQKAVAQCCRLAKFGSAQAKQGRVLATLSLVQFLSKFEINWTKHNFAKGPKQKPVAECCRPAKFGGAQAKQGRALATLFLAQIF